MASSLLATRQATALSEVGPGCLRYLDASAKIGAWIFGARHFVQGPCRRGRGKLRKRNIVLGHSRLDAPPTIGRVPRCRVSARILDMNVDFHELATLDHAETLDDV